MSSILLSNSILKSSVSTTGFLLLSQVLLPLPVIPNVTTNFFMLFPVDRNFYRNKG
jgi:hypothetical protein